MKLTFILLRTIAFERVLKCKEPEHCNAPIHAYLVWTVISCDCDVSTASEHMFVYLLVMCFVGTERGKRVFDGVGHDAY